MGQSHSQPQSAVVRPNRNPATSPETADAAPATPISRRERTTTSDSTRKRVSAFLRGGQHKRSASSQPTVGNGPTPSDPDTPTGAIAPLSVRSRSLRKLFGGGSKGRKSWAPPAIVTDDKVLSPAPVVDDEAGTASPEAALAPTDAQPSLASGSTPRNSSLLPSEGSSPTTPSSDKSLAIREIAMLSGSTPPPDTITSSKVEHVEEVPLPEEDPVVTLSRSVSLTSLVHGHITGDVVPLDVPALEDIPADVPTPPSMEPIPPIFDSLPVFGPSPSLTTPLVNNLQTGSSVLPSIPPPPPTIPSPLPVIPAGTTMIIQGVVQAAEERSSPRRNNNVTSSNAPRLPGADEATPVPIPQVESASDASADASASGTAVGNQDPDSPSGAADLLGALLIAAASATANMLLSDPPGSNQNSMTPPPPSYSPGEDSGWLEAHPSPTPYASSVGTGPRPRRPRMDSADRLSRPRSMINALRDRMFGGGRATDEDADLYDRIMRGLSSEERSRSRSERERPLSTSALDALSESRDPIESLRERIANELMRALAARDGTASPTLGSPGESSTPSNERGGTPVPAAEPLPPPPADTSITRIPLPTTSSGTATVVPAEGTFERFLHDTNAELRSTLLERMNQRENTAVPVPVNALPPTVPSTPTESEAPVETAPPPADETAAQQQTRLVHRAPEGVIEPRLNWWRLHRFPARQVAAPPSDAADHATSTMPPSPTISTSSPSNFATAPSATSTNPPSTTLIPVIVVGIRTAPTSLVQEIGALASASTTTPPEADVQTRRHSRRASGSGNDGSSRLGWSRAVDSLSRALAARRREWRTSTFGGITPGESDVPPLPVGPTPENETPAPTTDAASTTSSSNSRDRTRNYLIWVIGGYYPESHPILTSPNLLLNQIDQDDFWGLAELLGQVKPPVASKADIDRAGLEVIKAEKMKDYEKEGKVTNNTSERCLICLSDYEPEEDLRIMSCRHAFHQECVDKWLEVGRNNCPACRSKGVDVTDTVPPATA